MRRYCDINVCYELNDDIKQRAEFTEKKYRMSDVKEKYNGNLENLGMDLALKRMGASSDKNDKKISIVHVDLKTI